MGLFQKAAGGIRCLRENGLLYTLKRCVIKVLHKLLPEGVYENSRVFLKLILPGYRVLARLVRKYGDDTLLLSCAIRGTGDYYLCGMYLRTWVEQNHIPNFIFLTLRGAQQKVTELFPIYQNHTEIVTPEEEQLLRTLRAFVPETGRYFYHLDHQTLDIINGKQEVRTFQLMGYKDWTILSFYLEFGFGLTEDVPRDEPQFGTDTAAVDEIFYRNDLIPGKTVLLSPYSTSQLPFLFPEEFWIQLIHRFHAAGYTVCTNCAGAEQPLPGTIALFVPYQLLVPFLDRAGALVAIRSGLCDLAVTSTCKKVVLHTYKAMWWPDGNSISYTGLRKMGLCNEVLEFVPNMEHQRKAVNRILKYVL